MDTLLLLKNPTVVAKSCLVIQHKRPPPPPNLCPCYFKCPSVSFGEMHYSLATRAEITAGRSLMIFIPT